MVADDDGIGTALHGQQGILDIHDALEDQLAAPLPLDPFDVGPAQPRVELLVGPGGQAAHVADPLDVADQVAEGVASGAGHAQAPARLGQQVDDVAQRWPRWRGQAVFQIFVALADHLQVEREHQRAALRNLAAVDHAGHGLAVAHHVELEPERRARVLRNVLDRADAHRAQRERDAELLGRAGSVDFAIGMLHAGQAHRGDADRHLGVDTHHLGRGAAVLHVHRDTLAQLDLLEIAGVGAVGALGPAARIGVVVEHARHALLGQLAQVFDGGDDGHGRSPAAAVSRHWPLASSKPTLARCWASAASICCACCGNQIASSPTASRSGSKSFSSRARR